MDAYRYLTIKRDADIVRITMNRPDRRNALSFEHLIELGHAFTEVGDTDAMGIVLAGNGPVFCAGHDFADVASGDLIGVRELLRVCTALMSTIQSVPQVVIARVHALATAAGCQLVASCDLAVAGFSASFCLARRQGWLVLPHPAVAVARQYRAQAADGTRADRGAGGRAHRGGLGPDQLRGARRGAGQRGR